MKNILAFIISTSLLIMAVGCSGEGVDITEQRQIQFSLTQKGSNENWDVINNITGIFHNMERVYQSTHTLEIKPKNEIYNKEITISIKVNGKTIEYFEKRQEGDRHSNFIAIKDNNSIYKTKKELSHFDDNETLWDEDVIVIIEYGDKKEEIKLR